MQAAWTVNTIPASKPPTFHQQYYVPNHKIAIPTQTMSSKVPDEYISNELAMKRVFWPQSKSTSGFTKNEPRHVNKNEVIHLKPNQNIPLIYHT